ncbi:Formyl transferase [Gracilaria domingensis]|nr:Formyl transferase [Gracilaria domingensis]
MVSGSGRSLQNVCEQITSGQMEGCQVNLVIASKPTAGAISRAEHFGVPTRVVRQKDYDGNVESFSGAISHLLDEFKIDLVVMAGWMHFYLIPPRYDGKVINIHPSLIPSFCGKGYYGNLVHEAVVSCNDRIFAAP